MPRAEEMTWEAAKNRWRKMHKGVIYLVSPQRLDEEGYDVPMYTRDGSRKAANEWWRKKQAELYAPSPEQQIRQRWSVEDHVEAIRKAQEVIDTRQQLLFGLGYRPEVKGSDFFATVIHEDGHTNLDGLGKLVAQIEDKPADKERSVAHQLKRYLSAELARGQAPNTYADIAFHLNKMHRCPAFKLDMGIDCLKESTLTDIYAWLKNESKLAPNSQKKTFGYVRRFIKWLYGERLIDEKPRNIDFRIFSFDTEKVVKTYPTEDVVYLLMHLRERLQLYACLALNCGMYAVDMGQLLKTEWQGDRIIRKRTKMKKKEKVPVVNYKLWPETKALIEKFKSDDATYVFLSERGKPLWRQWIENGKKREANLIAVHWDKQSIPLANLRHVSSNLLKHKREFALAGLHDLFLGHAPNSMGEGHYYTYDQEHFDEAIMWLRTQYFGA